MAHFRPRGRSIVDRFDRRLILLSINSARAALLGVLALSVLNGQVTMPASYLVAFAIGVGEGFYDNAAESYVPAVVEAEDLDRANGRMIAAEVVGNEVAGPSYERAHGSRLRIRGG